MAVAVSHIGLTVDILFEGKLYIHHEPHGGSMQNVKQWIYNSLAFHFCPRLSCFFVCFFPNSGLCVIVCKQTAKLDKQILVVSPKWRKHIVEQKRSWQGQVSAIVLDELLYASRMLN